MKEYYLIQPKVIFRYDIKFSIYTFFYTTVDILKKSRQRFKLFTILPLLFIATTVQSQSSVVFTSNATWTCPSNVTTIMVEAWGAGAGGRTGSGSKGSTGPGGGGGAYARLNSVTVIPGKQYTLTVAGVTPRDTPGSLSTATFETKTITAVGGAVGALSGTNAAGGIGGKATDCTGDVRWSGGNGGDSYGDSSTSGAGSGGGGGSGAGSTNNGNPGLKPASYNFGGAGGAMVINNGGAGGKGADDGGSGANGSTIGYGGGGGGGGDKPGNGWTYVGGSGQNGAIIITYILPYGPGGVTNNLQLWLRSDLLDGTTNVADNSDVATWVDQALGSNASKPAAIGAPKYKNNAISNINFNAVVDFKNNSSSTTNNYYDTDSNRQYLKGTSGFYSNEIFAVVIPNSTVSSVSPRMAVFCGDKNTNTLEADITGIGLGSFTNRMNDEVITYALGTSSGFGLGYAIAHQSTTASYNLPGIINTRNNLAINNQELFYNGGNIANFTNNSTAFANVTNSPYWIGRSEGIDGTLDGRVAEIITYNTRTSDTERINIQSYLALKYGITLGVNGTATNYTNSSGAIIWNPADNAGYNFDIAGIGRDDKTRLNQKQSKSINKSDAITIGLGDIYGTNTANPNAFDADMKSLIWGNDNGALTSQSVSVNLSSDITTPTTLLTDVGYNKINRVWKVVENGGDVPSCKISIPASMLTATNNPAVTPGDYIMLISKTSTFDANSEARILTANGTNLETTYDFDGVRYITFGYAPEKTFVRCIQFDGVDDYLNSGNVLNLDTNFTVSAWVIRNGLNQTILSKRNNTYTQGYDLSINSAGNAEMSWFVGGSKKTITSNASLPAGKWHHIAVTYNGSTAKMYVDGINKISKGIVGAPSATTDPFVVAAGGSTPNSFFKGSLDEVRIWKSALTASQLRYVMNQEILNNGGLTNGVIVPNTITLNDIKTIPWTDLNAYYPMSTYSFNTAKDKSSYALNASIRNINTVDFQTAPIPYETAASGNWDTSSNWTNNTVQDLPNSVSIEDPNSTGLPGPPGLSTIPTIDWNIMRIKSGHTITSTGNKKALSLVLETNSNLIATLSPASQTDGSKIEVTHYLKLDGKIDLVGRSQLVQTEGSDLDITSSGSLERDQQGQANKYNYNYWSSPVGAVSSTSNNTAFTVGGVLKDGTNPAVPAAINWIAGYNGYPGPPISLARYWIYKFDASANDYANWVQILETGSLTAGKGFTLKGSGASSSTQNLTFVGKPNNGTITNTVGPNQLLLIGNPYPSAIDADKFITDNTGVLDVTKTDPTIDGALYFWEHYGTNSTHNLSGYQGGYAIRNLSGGVAPSAIGVNFIAGTGATSKQPPEQFIPVGQGFFVYGNAAGGNVVFKNSQRAFIKEENLNPTIEGPSQSQTMYRIPINTKILNHWTYNSNDYVPLNNHKKIRLGYNNYNETFHRQVLLAFMDEKANSEMNDGYDAVNIDDAPSDMYFINGENELAIQGEGYFDAAASYPIGVRQDAAGKISFNIDKLENFEPNQDVFLYDDLDESYHNLNVAPYEVELPKGTNNDRFFLRFTDKKLGTETFTDSAKENVIVSVNEIVTVHSVSEPIKNIVVFDLLGRKVQQYKKLDTLKFTLSHLEKSNSALILKITLDNNSVVSKKIIF